MNQSLCRLCYINPGVTPISNLNAGVQISTEIMYCCKNIQICEYDGYPLNICAFCEKDLHSSYLFITRCEETNTKLRSINCKHLKEEYVIENSSEKPFHLTEMNVTEISINLHNKDTEHKKSDLESGKEDAIFIKDSLITHSYICSVCCRQYPNQSKFKVHIRSHTNKQPYSCLSCDKKYKDRGSLKKHIVVNHSKVKRERKFICETCGKGFFTKADVTIHLRTHTGETPYVCIECPARFTQIGAFRRHKLRHTGERPYTCTTCVKKFYTKEELTNHSVVHTSTREYSCPTCSTNFKHKNSLRKHIRQHSITDRFTCNYCNHNFSLKNNLMSHIKRLHSSKSGFCNICSKDVSNIEIHTWKHTGERPLQCEFCASSFSNKNSLTKHINKRHRFKNKYECMLDGCVSKFSSQFKLDYHNLKIHGNIIPFPCDRCPRGFYRKSDLARHRIASHKELPE